MRNFLILSSLVILAATTQAQTTRHTSNATKGNAYFKRTETRETRPDGTTLIKIDFIVLAPESTKARDRSMYQEKLDGSPHYLRDPRVRMFGPSVIDSNGKVRNIPAVKNLALTDIPDDGPSVTIIYGPTPKSPAEIARMYAQNPSLVSVDEKNGTISITEGAMHYVASNKGNLLRISYLNPVGPLVYNYVTSK